MKGKVAALAGMISALLLALVIVAGWTSDGLTLHYLDVGKCNCVLAESPDGSFMMIDAGSNGEKDTRRILEYLKAQGVETLEYLLITHPHKDHIRAAERAARTELIRHAQRVGELARYVVAAAARLTGDGDYESSHLTPPFKLRGTPCAPGRPQRAPRPRPPWRCCRSQARRPCR